MKKIAKTVFKWGINLLLVLVMVFSFPVWITWLNAMSVNEAEVLYGRKFPENWKAVNVNHDVFSNQELGLAKNHPVKFLLLTFLTFGPAAIFFYRGFRTGYLNSQRDDQQGGSAN